MTIERKLLGTNPVATGGASPEAVSFDGTNDYLSRSSDLTGNADGKTMTFSLWIYLIETPNSDPFILQKADGSDGIFKVSLPNGLFNISAEAATGGEVLTVTVAIAEIPLNTFNHILVSVDMTSTSNRHVYINDSLISATWVLYNNAAFDFTGSKWAVNTSSSSLGNNQTKKRMSHLFLDYTYRDLSIAANRRLFIDADGKPADGQADLSPILYLPMKDADTAGSNSGTGGDFTVNGILATAERGPNQDNCVASVFDGSNDYLSKTSITGMYSSNEKVITVSYIVQFTGSSFTEEFLWMFTNNSDTYMTYQDRTHRMHLGTGGSAMNLELTGNRWKANGQMTISIDLSDTSKRHVFFNGVDITSDAVFHSYNNTDIGFGSFTRMFIGSRFGTAVHYQGNIGEFYVNNVYHDLATDNPFWNSDTNLPNSVRKVISDTGVTPLIALPIIGSDAGKNYGSIGDFTVNSGPFTGARGGSEYWARSAGASGSGYLRNASLSASNGKNVTFVFAYTVPASAGVIQFENGSGSQRMKMFLDTNGGFDFEMMNSSGGNVLRAIASSVGASLGAWCVALISVDLTNSSNRSLYINGSIPTTNWSTYSNTDIAFSEMTQNDIFQGNGGFFPFDLGAMYFNNSYTDFSQEANRNKFVDQLGYPRDLTQQIEDGDIPEPLIYMKFDDTTDLGKNSGTGGDFTVNGTVTAGSDVNP